MKKWYRKILKMLDTVQGGQRVGIACSCKQVTVAAKRNLSSPVQSIVVKSAEPRHGRGSWAIACPHLRVYLLHPN